MPPFKLATAVWQTGFRFVQLNLPHGSAIVSAYDFDGKDSRPRRRQAARAGR
jgi:hypothetical protein